MGEGELQNHSSEHKAAPERPELKRRRFPTGSDPQLPVENMQTPMLQSNTYKLTMEERDQQETFSDHKAAPEPPGRSGDGSQWGSWCCGTGRRRSRVLLTAACAALGALILLLVVLISTEEENDWNSSREHCNAHAASLATIGSAEEMDFMMRFQGQANCWIGLHREEEDGQWTWSDGTAFTSWFQLRGGGRCAYLNGDRVSSSLCHLHKHWVCSRADRYVLWKQKAHPE